MAASDDDNDDLPVNELEVFRDEIRDTMRRSLTDKTTFRSLIAEVEQLRTAYKQDLSTLNKAVLWELFKLPFATQSQPMQLNPYFKSMEGLFETYNPLIKSLKRDKKTQQEGSKAVAEPLIDLMTSGKLSYEEWVQGQNKSSLQNLLIHYGVIAESQIALAFKIIDDAFGTADEYLPSDKGDIAGPSSALASEASEEAAAVDTHQRLVGLKRKLPSPLCTGVFSSTFTHVGGKLGYWMTDDYLEIPEGAIPEGETWTVQGNIYTSLDDFTDMLKKPKGECFVAAITEYKVVGDYEFKKHVKVIVHHSVYNPQELANLCIQLHDDKNGIIDVPYKTGRKDNDSREPWYEVVGPQIIVYTTHFTKVVCKICNSKECYVNAVKGLLYGKITGDGNNKFFATVEVYVHCIHNVEHLPVFSEVFSREQDLAGCRLIKAKPFPALDEMISGDKVKIEFTSTDPEWRLLPASDFHDYETVINNSVRCLAEAYDPVCLGTFLLQGPSSVLNGNVTLSIGGTHTIKLPFSLVIAAIADATSVATTAATAALSEARSPNEGILPDHRLNEIAKKFNPDTFFDVGFKFGLTYADLQHLETNNSNQTTARKILNMLHDWWEKQPKTADQELKSAEVLRQILRETFNREALELLDKYIATKTVNKTVDPAEVANSAASSSNTDANNHATDEQTKE